MLIPVLDHEEGGPAISRPLQQTLVVVDCDDDLASRKRLRRHGIDRLFEVVPAIVRVRADDHRHADVAHVQEAMLPWISAAALATVPPVGRDPLRPRN
jgi:hypothetical protein